MTTERSASIPGPVRRALIAHARRDAPNECCGLLIGRGRRVDLAVPLANVDPNPHTGFRIDPAEHIAVRRVLRRLTPALQIVGAYHSHPAGPAKPSPRDVREAHYPDWLFAIVGCSGPDRRVVRVFQIRTGRAVPVRVRWTGAARHPYTP